MTKGQKIPCKRCGRCCLVHLIAYITDLDWKEKSAICAICETRSRVCEEFMPGSSELCPQLKLPSTS